MGGGGGLWDMLERVLSGGPAGPGSYEMSPSGGLGGGGVIGPTRPGPDQPTGPSDGGTFPWLNPEWPVPQPDWPTERQDPFPWLNPEWPVPEQTGPFPWLEPEWRSPSGMPSGGPTGAGVPPLPRGPYPQGGTPGDQPAEQTGPYPWLEPEWPPPYVPGPDTIPEFPMPQPQSEGGQSTIDDYLKSILRADDPLATDCM
jgi:hypothetical protein